MRDLLTALTTSAAALAVMQAVSVVGIRNAHAAEPIVIGNIGTVSNSFAKYSEYSPMQRAVQAWADWTNKHGGINEHPIRVEVADDENSPAKHLSRVQELVEQKHVVAFVGNPAVDTQPASVRYLEENGVPAIGGALGNEMWGRSPMLFPHGIAEVQRARMLMQTAALTGKHKFAFLAIPKNPRQMIIKALTSGPAQEAGIQVVFDAVVENEADNTAACLGAEQAGVEIVTVAAPFEILANVMESCARVGFKPSYVMTGTLTSPQLITAAGKDAEGAIGPSRFLPWEGDKPAELKTYRQIMNTHTVSISD
jgi:branched-chain amino acid transport system substrate-binding protein